MALKLPSYPVPVQYEYKPMALEAFAQPLAQLQQRFDTTKTALEDADLGINALTPDSARSKELQNQLLTKQQELTEELYRTKDSAYIAREIKKLNNVLNKNPEITGLRTQYNTYKELDADYRKRQEEDPTNFPDFWRQQDMRSRSYEYDQAGGLGYDWESGNYNSFDNRPPITYLEAEVMKHAETLANTRAEDRRELAPEIFMGISGEAKDRIISLTSKNLDEMTREIAQELRNSTRYKEWLNYEGKTLFNNEMAGLSPDERVPRSEEIISTHRQKIQDYVDNMTKKAEGKNINLEEYEPYRQAIEYLGEIDKGYNLNASQGTLENFAKAIYAKDHRDTRLNDFAYGASDIENFENINSTLSGGSGSGGSKGLDPLVDAPKYQVQVQGSQFRPENEDGTAGTPTFADYGTNLESLKTNEIFATYDKDQNTIPSAYPELGNYIMNKPTNIKKAYTNNTDILNANETYQRKADAIYSVGHIAENTASRATDYETWINTSTNIIADLKDKKNNGTITNDENAKLKELITNVPGVKAMYFKEFANINLDLQTAANSDSRLKKIIEENGGEFNAKTYTDIANSYQTSLDEIIKLAQEEENLANELATYSLGYDPAAPGAAQSEPMVGIDLLQREEVDLVEEGIRNQIDPFDEGRLLRKAEIEARIQELQKQQDLVKNVAPSVFREWNNSLNIKESSRTISLYPNEALSKFTGDKVNELIKTIKEGGTEGLDVVDYDAAKAEYTSKGTIKSEEIDWSSYATQTPNLEVVLDDNREGQTVILSYNRDETKLKDKDVANRFLYDQLNIIGLSGMSFQDWVESGEATGAQEQYNKSNPKKLYVAVKNTNFGNTITKNAANTYVALGEQELMNAGRALAMGPAGQRLQDNSYYMFGTLLTSMSNISLVSNGEMQKDYMQLSAAITAGQRQGEFAAIPTQETADGGWKELEGNNKEGYRIVYDLDAENRVVANVFKQTVNSNYEEIGQEFVHEIILTDFTPSKLHQLDLLYGTGSSPVYSDIKQSAWVPMHTDLKSTLPANAVGIVKENK